MYAKTVQRWVIAALAAVTFSATVAGINQCVELYYSLQLFGIEEEAAGTAESSI